MNKALDFTIFCLESYKQAHGISGKDASMIFEQYRVFDYIKSSFDVLHSTGQNYIVQDIDQYIQVRSH